MKYNESNFTYLKKTSMEKYYDELVKAEHVCEYFPKITKLIVRKVIEGLLKNIAEKYNIESNVAIWNLFNHIKFNPNFSLSEEIQNSIISILANGYEHVSINNGNKKIPKHPIETLETIHNILCWYLKKAEPKAMILIEDLSFKAPSTIEYQQKEVDRIKHDILLKENQIDNLRQKIIELGSALKNVSELNKIIMAIKDEKYYLENMQMSLIKKILVQKDQIVDIEQNYQVYINKFDKLEKRCNENHELMFNKESQLVKAEIQKQEVKNLVKELDEQDETIRRRTQYIEEELKIARQSYENLLKLTTQYQDILETIEFGYDKELQKVLDAQKNNVKMQISFEDRIFSENINMYTKNISDAKRKIVIFKEILNENIKREIKYEPFYRGFLILEYRELRIIYTMITYVNMDSNLISKSKELLSNSNEDKFLELINRNLEELKNISDDEIKLILYYKLIKLSQSPFGNIYNRKQFIQTLDSMVDRAYEILMAKKDFKGRVKKLDAINAYYLEKIISDLKNKNSNIQINEELADRIYKNIIILKKNADNIEKKHIYYDKLDLDNMSEAIFKTAIKSQVFAFLSIMVELGGIASNKETSNIIFEVSNLIRKKPSAEGYIKETLPTNFSNEYFIIILFLSSGATLFSQKEHENLLPLLIITIMSKALISDDDIINLENYNNMVDLWKRKQQRYNDIFIEKENKENVLETLIKENQMLEVNYEQLSRDRVSLSQKHDNYKEEFKQIVMTSEKRILLPSYLNYDELSSKKEEAENNINDSRNKFGAFKSMLSPEVWKEHASKSINESNMRDAEMSLIEEAKQKPYFKKEYSVFLDLERKIEELDKLINKEKENIQNKGSLIEGVKVKINELQRQISTIKDVYLDIEEGYY